MTEAERRRARRAVADALADRDDWTFRRPLGAEDDYLVAEVTVGGRRAVCKVARGDPTSVRRERCCYRRVANVDGVPTPAVLDAGDRHLVVEHRGESYDGDATRARRRARLHAVGATLARLHEATAFPACGDLESTVDGPELDAARTWPDRCRELTADLAQRHAGGPFEDVATDALERVRSGESILRGAGEPVLVHGDVGADNLRFAGDGVAAVVDWEVAAAAPGEFDLARAELEWFLKPHSPEVGGDLRGALVGGYESVRPLPEHSAARRDLYRAVLTLGPLATVDEVVAAADVERDDIAASMRNYVEERLAAAAEPLG